VKRGDVCYDATSLGLTSRGRGVLGLESGFDPSDSRKARQATASTGTLRVLSLSVDESGPTAVDLWSCGPPEDFPGRRPGLFMYRFFLRTGNRLQYNHVLPFVPLGGEQVLSLYHSSPRTHFCEPRTRVCSSETPAGSCVVPRDAAAHARGVRAGAARPRRAVAGVRHVVRAPRVPLRLKRACPCLCTCRALGRRRPHTRPRRAQTARASCAQRLAPVPKQRDLHAMPCQRRHRPR